MSGFDSSPLSDIFHAWQAAGRTDAPTSVRLQARAYAEIRKFNQDVIVPVEQNPTLWAILLGEPWDGVSLVPAPQVQQAACVVVGADGFEMSMSAISTGPVSEVAEQFVEFKDADEWLDEANKRLQEGHKLLPADDPRLRVFGFADVTDPAKTNVCFTSITSVKVAMQKNPTRWDFVRTPQGRAERFSQQAVSEQGSL